MDLSPTIKEVQRAVGVTADGIAGPLTWAAILKAVSTGPVVTSFPAALPADRIDERSEENIANLHPVVQNLARQLILLLGVHGINAKVTSGFRSPEEQEVLYEQGRTTPGKIVTYARPGYSNHNFGLAFDVTLFDGSKPVYESPLYTDAGWLGKSIGLLWGGDWHSSDEPHFELRPEWAKDLSEDEALAQYRLRTSESRVLV